MKEYRLTVEMENQFIRYLIQEEKSSHTVEKYQRDLKKFVQFLGGQEVTKDLVIEYKKSCLLYTSFTAGKFLSE